MNGEKEIKVENVGSPSIFFSGIYCPYFFPFFFSFFSFILFPHFIKQPITHNFLFFFFFFFFFI
ncbi:uncharacterized protein EV154DRAFT_497314, partial [Mucor mucedo]|uniref:uncharacterized protein n=1 Tax=Mucor mucedo TaxID=29922 RepID=UPI002220B309